MTVKLLTVEETAELLNVSRRHVDRMIKAGKLKKSGDMIELNIDALKATDVTDFNLFFYEAIAGIIYGNRSFGAGFLEQVDDPAFVYLVGAGEYIKIGASRDFEKRIRTIKTYCPFELEVIAVAVGGFQTEAILHNHFAKLRVRRDGEWFRREGNLALLASMLKGTYQRCNS